MLRMSVFMRWRGQPEARRNRGPEEHVARVRDRPVSARPAAGRLRGYERAASTAAALGLAYPCVAALAALVFGASGSRIATLTSVYVVMAVGLMTFSGNTGIISFSQPGFAGVGVHVSGILSMPEPLQRSALPGPPALVAGHAWPVCATPAVAIAVTALVGLAGGTPLASGDRRPRSPRSAS